MSQKSDFSPIPGRPYHLRPGLDLLLAPNPSPMTYLGTNTYLVGWDTVILIDPGPDSDEHLSSIIAAIDGRSVAHILVTHSHKDHSGLATRLSELTCAPVSAFGDSYAGRSKVMTRLAEAGLVGGGEGVDFTFQPDIILRDGDQVKLERLQIDVLHTPGHMSNHLCFAWGRSVFTGDHVMGWASSLVSPPDGDLTDFMQSCGKLKSKGADMFYPGHGAPVAEPQERLD